MILTEKYRPKILSEVKGHNKEKEEIIQWLKTWKDHKKPLLLSGRAGIGKTTMAYCLAKDNDLELFETNSSDERTKDLLEKNVSGALIQQSLFNRSKLILFDEVDGSKTSEKTQLFNLLEMSKFPIILTCNDLYSRGMDKLRNKCQVIQLRKIHTNTLTSALKEICQKENIQYEDMAIKLLASRANGDFRMALNDLYLLGEIVTLESIKNLTHRDLGQNIFDSLVVIFKTEKIENSKQATDNLNEDVGMLLEWIRENITAEYEKKHEIAKAFYYLSLASLYQGRIIKRQFWSLLKYVYDFLTGGISVSKDEKYRKFSRYQFPSTIRKRSTLKKKKDLRKNIEGKFMEKMHLSSKDFYEFVKLFEFLMKDKELKENLIQEFELEKEELEYIREIVKS